MNCGCKAGLPHDYRPTNDGPTLLSETCVICGDRQKWNKDERGRVANKDYLEAHIRDFCQPTGPHAQLYYLLYAPELYNENKWKWTTFACLNDTCVKTNRCPHGRVEKHSRRDLTKQGTNANQ